MLTILICWAVGGLIGLGWGIFHQRAKAPEKAEVEGVQSPDYLPILLEAFAALSPNSRGRGSVAFLNLSTAIQKLEAGERIAPGVLVYLLNQIEGAGPWAERIKGAGA